MLKLWMITLVSLFLFSVQAKNKVVYGTDDRLDLFQVTNPMHLTSASATAGMVSSTKLRRTSDGYSLTAGTLKDRGICSDAKFANQPTTATCSGFLVGPDLLVTAGHCMRTASSCSGNSWVFGIAYETSDIVNVFQLGEDKVYKCKEIISQKLDGGRGDDYALIRLDREVVGVTPLEVRSEGRIEVNQGLYVIGHPTGLPTKVADNANVRNNENDFFFIANLDTFAGNSGSAVFNAETGVVEGILVRGEQDYVRNWSKGCREPKICENSSCRGEDVTRITNIPELKTLLNN